MKRATHIMSAIMSRPLRFPVPGKNALEACKGLRHASKASSVEPAGCKNDLQSVDPIAERDLVPSVRGLSVPEDRAASLGSLTKWLRANARSNSPVSRRM